MKRLEHETDTIGTHLGATVFIELGEVGAVQHDVSVSGQVQAGKQREQRRLAGAGWPDDRHGLTGHNAKLTSERMVRLPSGLLTFLLNS